MSTDTLPYPAQMRDWLSGALPGRPHVGVIPRDPAGRKCAALGAAYYEVHACPVASGERLAEIEAVLRSWPGCFRLTRVGWIGEPETLTRSSTLCYQITDPDWPTTARANDIYTRPMIWALIRDPDAAQTP
jgi:hypothetical protein